MSTDPMQRPIPLGHLFTFAVVYGTGEDRHFEEIDVEASNEDDALRAAEATAVAELQPGWERIVPMAPGGTAGLVQW